MGWLLQPKWYALHSSRKRSKISGEVQLQFTIIDPANHAATPEQILHKFFTLAAADLEDDEAEVDDEDTEDGVGKVDSKDTADDDDDVEDTSDETDDPSKPETVEKKRKRRLRLKLLKRNKKARAYEFMGESDVVGIVFLEISKITDLPPEKNGKSRCP